MNRDINMPSVDDYFSWMIKPLLLGLVTFGLGGVALIIVWAENREDTPRTRYAKAVFRLIITIAGIACGVYVLAIAAFFIYAVIKLSYAF